MYALSSKRKVGKFQFSCQTFVDCTQKWSTLSIENLSTKIFVLWSLTEDYFQFLKFGRFAKHDTFSRTLIRPTTILPCMIVTRVKLGKDMVLYFYDTRLKCLKFGHARINGLRRLFFFVFLRNNDKMLRTKIKVKPLCA